MNRGTRPQRSTPQQSPPVDSGTSGSARPDILIEQLGKLGDFERTVLEKALREQRERATYLAFVRDHIDPDVVYRLGPSDLRMIDLAPLPRY